VDFLGRLSNRRGTIFEEHRPKEHFIAVGVDLGQRRDPTAICVTESEIRETGEKTVIAYHDDGSLTQREEVAPYYLVRHLERQALGTSYPDVAARLSEIVAKLDRDFSEGYLAMVMDATGVGQPVVDIVRAALQGGRCRMTGAILTGSEKMEGHPGAREVRLGKLHLVSNLQALLQQGRIGLPETAEARQLAEELLDFELRVNENANLISGAFRTGAHDDLVVALGLSCLDDPRRHQVGLGPAMY
jgi:hypothetical protein